ALADLPGRPSAAGALVGADAVLPDGAAVNRTGSYPLALAAAAADRPFRVVAARDKVRPDDAAPDEREEVSPYDGDAPVDAACPLFERVPGDLVDAVVTEAGVLDAAGVAAVADRHREHAAWDG
ncbi:MAG: translation initiation factor 2, partial [Haloferacaceae archaeon]